MQHLILVFAMLMPPPTVDDVVAMQARIPNECSLGGAGACPKSWGPPHYEALNDAREIAEAIAAGVKGEANPWNRAALGAIYAAYESNNRRCISGDGGTSWGSWQIQGVNKLTACTPMSAFPVWLVMVSKSEAICATLPEEERLAVVASGNCQHGRTLSRRRWGLQAKVLGFLEPVD